MKKIVLIPLDERPCNINFPKYLAKGKDYSVITPPIEIMGNKKSPGNVKLIWEWLYNEVQDAYGVILSVDTLLYGGIVPSRLHYDSLEILEERLSSLKKLKKINPELRIFAFNLIMRCPSYSSSDEEPDYYEDWGYEIFRFGYINHKKDLGIVTEEELRELDSINLKLPKEHLNDYLNRRNINTTINKRVIDYVKDGIIDFLIIPQDDSAPYGLTALDQQKIRKYINDNSVALKVYMYPGADEVANTLLARMINEDKKLKPLVYIRYSSVSAPFVIPLYEDRLLHESVKYQILAAGGLIASSINEADIVLLVNAPSDKMLNASESYKRGIEYDVFRNLIEIVEYSDYVINRLNKPCVIGDVAYGNGSDLELIKLISQKGLMFKLAGYAGWNTSSNSLGTCIPQGMIYNIFGNTEEHRDFLALRYVEDAGYCAYVRQKVCKEFLPTVGLNYFKADSVRGIVSDKVKEELEKFIKDNLHCNKYSIEIIDCYMPWKRMFEVGLQVKAVKK